MTEEQKLEKLFREDLAKLLKKHNAEITLSQRGSCYMGYDVIEVEIDSIWDYEGENCNQISPMVTFDL